MLYASCIHECMHDNDIISIQGELQQLCINNRPYKFSDNCDIGPQASTFFFSSMSLSVVTRIEE